MASTDEHRWQFQIVPADAQSPARTMYSICVACGEVRAEPVGVGGTTTVDLKGACPSAPYGGWGSPRGA